ncbi:helix-turn-helix domain-containing protein [Companilactobacillus allii]|uniref:Transcriptional regulator n=1 Tax=Companilactobacillus allii TaxID=1847728 RepID=A0A1P8Q4C6_9LACO|nr:helix-turn-helix transcriptional regulator [Companilactobacillus allii]APX72687.1 transcriptional regulator [Companilactobacillus allii]USQ69793.1 helix-turn-helix domain-containing protein [Companilactobacillus allii]
MPEAQLASYARKIESEIKIALIQRNMTQRELAKLIGTGTQQLNRAIKGDMTPKSRELRKKIEKILFIEG